MPQRRILVVEDDDSIRQLLMEYLREHSCVSVDGARDGADALHRVTTTKYAVVILDVMMPYMTGIDFLDSLEAMMSDPSIKGMDERPAVVVITAASPDHVSSRSIEDRFPLMVRSVFRKPLDMGELGACVESLLGR